MRNNPLQRRTWRDIEEIDGIKAHAELAKRGIQMLESYDDQPRSAILEERAKLRRVVNDITHEVKQAIGKDNDRADELMGIVDTLGLWIYGCDEKLSHLDLADAHFLERGGPGGVSRAAWRTAEGRVIPVLSKDDRLSDLPDGGPTPKASFGEVIRAMALGTSNPDIRASLSEGTDSAGGYTVPTQLLRQVIDAMRNRTVVIQAGAVTVPLETLKTSIARLATDPAASWRAENGAVGESDPTFEKVEFVARSLAVLVKVSRELLEDSVNLDQALMQAFAGAMAVELDRVALFGSGTAPEPRGIFNTTGVGSVSLGANGAALANYDPLIDLLQALQDANAPAPTAAVMAPRTSTTLAKLKDTTNQPLRKPEALAALPFLVTKQVPINQTQGTAIDASCVLSGDFTQVMIGVRAALRIELLRELYAANHQYAFVAHLRADVQLAQPPALAKLIGIIP